jgi:hypothetical protein
MSTSPIQSSGGYAFPPPELAEDPNAGALQDDRTGVQEGDGDGLSDVGPRARLELGDRAVPLGTVAGNRPLPGNADQAMMGHRGSQPADQNPPTTGAYGGADAGRSDPGNAGRPSPPDRGTPGPPRADAPPSPSGNGPATGNGQAIGNGSANWQPPGAAQMPTPGHPGQAIGNGQGQNGHGWGNNGNGNGHGVGNNGNGFGNAGNGYGAYSGLGNGGNGFGTSVGHGIGSLLSNLLGGNSSSSFALPSLISSQSLSSNATNALLNNPAPVPTSTPGAIVPNNHVATPQASASHVPTSTQTAAHIVGSENPSARVSAQTNMPASTSSPHSVAAGSTQHTNHLTQTSGAVNSPQTAGNTSMIARPQAAAGSPEATHNPIAMSSARSVGGEPVAQTPAVARAQMTAEALSVNGQQNAAATAQNAATRQNGTMVQAVAAQTSLLTLVMSAQMQAGNDDGSVTHMPLFRGQTADGQENIRDILGRSYVFNAEGKLTTRAEERRAIDAIGSKDVDEISESSASSHGELSTHELIWKVVTPALVGVGALLGGATASAAVAAGSSGIASAFLLTAATAIFGYGATRGALSLRAMADAGESINPIGNSIATKQWLATGTQSIGGMASLVSMIL